MNRKFPVAGVFAQALFAPLSNFVGLFRSIVIIGFSFLILYLYGGSQGLTEEIVHQIIANDGSIESGQYALPVLKTSLLSIIILLAVSTNVFNYWVRFGAYGVSGISFGSAGKAFSAMLVNMVKFFFIYMLIFIIAAVLQAVFSIFGIGADETAQKAAFLADDMRSHTILSFTENITIILASCFVYY